MEVAGKTQQKITQTEIIEWRSLISTLALPYLFSVRTLSKDLKKE